MKTILVIVGLVIVGVLFLVSPCRPDDTLWSAICQVESSGNPSAYNRTEQAVGISQIRPIVVDDLNRIFGEDTWTLEDRWCPEKSREIFFQYTGYWIRRFAIADSRENRSRIWNGGPRGYQRSSTVPYWDRVRKQIEKRM